MKCAELEILLSDYLDDTLSPAVRSEIDAHLGGCPDCAELLRDMRTAVAFLARVEAPEPPAELITRILFHAPVNAEARQNAECRTRRGTLGWLTGWISPLLQPRFAMGLAMTLLLFSMVARITGLPQRPLTMADLEPARVWASIDDKAHRTWDRAVKYYENLRLVYEIKDRLQQWSAQEEEERRAQPVKPIEPATRQSPAEPGAQKQPGGGPGDRSPQR